MPCKCRPYRIVQTLLGLTVGPHGFDHAFDHAFAHIWSLRPRMFLTAVEVERMLGILIAYSCMSGVERPLCQPQETHHGSNLRLLGPIRERSLYAAATECLSLHEPAVLSAQPSKVAITAFCTVTGARTEAWALYGRQSQTCIPPRLADSSPAGYSCTHPAPPAVALVEDRNKLLGYLQAL